MYLSYTYTPTASNNHTAPNLKSTLFAGGRVPEEDTRGDGDEK